MEDTEQDDKNSKSGQDGGIGGRWKEKVMKRRAMSRGERSLVVRLPNPVSWGTWLDVQREGGRGGIGVGEEISHVSLKRLHSRSRCAPLTWSPCRGRCRMRWGRCEQKSARRESSLFWPQPPRPSRHLSEMNKSSTSNSAWEISNAHMSSQPNKKVFLSTATRPTSLPTTT